MKQSELEIIKKNISAAMSQQVEAVERVVQKQQESAVKMLGGMERRLQQVENDRERIVALEYRLQKTIDYMNMEQPELNPPAPVNSRPAGNHTGNYFA